MGVGMRSATVFQMEASPKLAKKIPDKVVSMSQNLFDTILKLGLVAITLLFLKFVS